VRAVGLPAADGLGSGPASTSIGVEDHQHVVLDPDRHAAAPRASAVAAVAPPSVTTLSWSERPSMHGLSFALNGYPVGTVRWLFQAFDRRPLIGDREDTSDVEGSLGLGLASSSRQEWHLTQTRSTKGEVSPQETKSLLTRTLTSTTSRKAVGEQKPASPRNSR
jgi:hypothetical protein